MGAMPLQQLETIGEGRRVRWAILGIVRDDAMLMGTMAGLARGLRTTIPTLRSCIHELMETRRITVEVDRHGRLTIRRPD